MAFKFIEESNEQISLEEFVEYVRNEVDFTDQDSIQGASKALFKLHNNRKFITNLINDELKSMGLQKNNLYAGQSLILHSEPSFLVRAVTWLPESKNETRRALERDINFYGIAHDHAFNLLTIGYHGPGYETDFYEYDRSKVAGYIGEDIEMEFLERTRLGFGKILFMREAKDIHIQYPPEEMSISLNLMSQNHANTRNMEQFIFDIEKKKIIGYPHYGVSNRTSLIDAAAAIANENTLDILQTICISHIDPRTRLQAFKSLYLHLGDQVIKQAAQDPHKLVNEAYKRGELVK